MFEFLSNFIVNFFIPSESEYIESWDNYSDEFTVRENFLMNTSPEDLWNINFHYYNLVDISNKYHQDLLKYENLFGEQIF